MHLCQATKSELVEKYLDGMPSSYLAEKYGVHISTVTNIVKSMGFVSNSPGARRVYEINTNAFADLCQSRAAYWFGLMLADGNIYGNILQYDCLDRELVEGLLEFLESDHPLKVRKTSLGKPIFYTRISCKEFITKLKLMGFDERKSLNLAWPKHPVSVPDFVRGYFDGDGSLSFSRDRNYKRWTFSILGTEEFLQRLGDEIVNQVGVSIRIKPHKTIFQLAVRGNRQIATVLDWLYESSNPSIRLSRKYDRYKTLMDELPR